LAACSTVGRPFHSDAAALSQLIVGQTTPDEAVRILGAEPYIRQNLPDGTLAWHWQSIAAGAYVGVTDNRLLVLQFKRADSDATWRFYRVLHSQNVVLPPGMPFGSTVN
jgi:hypothetical protein